MSRGDTVTETQTAGAYSGRALVSVFDEIACSTRWEPVRDEGVSSFAEFVASFAFSAARIGL